MKISVRLALLAAVAGVFTGVNSVAFAQGNIINDAFNHSKKLLEEKVYYDHRVTFYCQAPFDKRKNIDLPEGFVTPAHEKRALRVEWEHVVPAENFGRVFKEWRTGDSRCVDNKGRAFKGRKCAEKVNKEYRYMQADMHNLFPAIGAVNALRSNYRYTTLPYSAVTFGSCPMKIDGKRVEPPEYTRGAIARATLYMSDAYPRYNLSAADRALMNSWNKDYPPDAWECLRERRIARLQGNANEFVREACRQAGL